MPTLSTGGRTSEQKNQLNSIPSAQFGIPETAQFPNSFHFWNGDEYIGHYAVIKDKQRIIMQGSGVYKTSDGQTYEGIWENDCLKDKCKVTFPGELVFSGNLDEMVIQGLGTYKLKKKVEIEGVFANNSLTGKVHLKDPHRHTWRGKVEKAGTCINFYPLHPFWQSVLNLPSKAVQMFYEEAEEENSSTWEEVY